MKDKVVQYKLNVAPFLQDIIVHGKMTTSQLGLFSMFLLRNEVSFTLDELKQMSPVDKVEDLEATLIQLGMMGYIKQEKAKGE